MLTSLPIRLASFVAAATVALMIVAFLPGPALAQGSCSAVIQGATNNTAIAQAFPSTRYTGCSAGMAYGAATLCSARTQFTFYVSNLFLARWPSATARTLDATGGCVFMCTSGDCRVGNDGLPVELLHFGVQ